MSRFVHCLPLAGEGMADKMDYASAGVDIDLEGSACLLYTSDAADEE